MKLHLGNSVWIGNIDTFFKTLDLSDESKLLITSHEKWVSVHPVVLTIVAALGLQVRNKGKDIDFEIMQAASKHYFERMGLFRILELNSEMKIKKHEPSGRFVPLQIIKTASELDFFITEIIPLLHKEPANVAPIKYVIYELVRNVIEHASSEIGAVVCAQYYKKSNRIRLGVTDAGIGIKESISKSYTPNTDLEAIKMALTPGITGTTRLRGGTEENAGAGLFFTKSLAKSNRDFFMIYSGRAMYKLLKTPRDKTIKLHSDPFQDHCSVHEDFPYWQGTIVAIDLCLDDHEEFEKVLRVIRDFYRKKRREMIKQRYKRPRFI